MLEESPEPVVYLHGTHSGIFPKIEDALNGKKVGDSISITLEPVDAFGEYDAKMIRIEPVADLPPDIAIGGYLVAEQDGAEVVWRVTGIADGKAVLDGNHELAGQRLRFDCNVLDVRAASAGGDRARSRAWRRRPSPPLSQRGSALARASSARRGPRAPRAATARRDRARAASPARRPRAGRRRRAGSPAGAALPNRSSCAALRAENWSSRAR